jgi:hypothetical protein
MGRDVNWTRSDNRRVICWSPRAASSIGTSRERDVAKRVSRARWVHPQLRHANERWVTLAPTPNSRTIRLAASRRNVIAREHRRILVSSVVRSPFVRQNKNPLTIGRKRVFKMAGWTGLEPATFCVTGRRSNQLSYHPVKWERRRNVGLRGGESSAVFPCRFGAHNLAVRGCRAVVAQLDRAAVF